jgi:hypothetical protein
MGFVHAEITLKNAKDIYRAEDGLIKDAEIRQTTITALVDTGVRTLVINEKLRLQLGPVYRGNVRQSWRTIQKRRLKLPIRWRSAGRTVR